MLANAINTYKTVLRKPELLDKENEILEAKRQELLKMVRVIFPNENISFDTSVSQEEQIKQIAKIQSRLDVYAYTNRKELDGTRDRIAELNGLEKNAENREALLKEIEDLIIKYKVFGRYVEARDWENLYRAKFEVLMCDINQREESPLKDAKIDDEELEYYKKIVEDKISRIKRGEKPEFENSFGKDKLAEAIRIIDEILKGDNTYYDAGEILQDMLKLRLIQAFDRPNGIEELTVNKNEKNIKVDNDVFTWASVIPIKSLWQLTQEEYKFYLMGDANLKGNILVRFYALYNEHRRENEIKEQNIEGDKESVKERAHAIPEGIIKIQVKHHFDAPELSSFRKRNYDKIIFPSTLEEIGHGFIDGTDVSEIEFNEGLEIIGVMAFFYCKNLGRNKNMKMPQSLKKIGCLAFSECPNMLPLILNEGLEEIDDFAFKNSYNCSIIETYQPATIIILPSTVKKIGFNIVSDLYVRNLGFKNYHGQKIPNEIFESLYDLRRYHGSDIDESTRLENIFFFEGDSLEPYMRIDPKELFGGYYKSNKLRGIVARMKEEKEREGENER